MLDMTEIEACQRARLMFLPRLEVVACVPPGQVCVVVKVEAVFDEWLRVSQQPVRAAEAVREGVVATVCARVLCRSVLEWELLGRLGVRRLPGELELWPATHKSCEALRARLILDEQLALSLGLRIEWEVA
jgi:hypothetical protein